MKLYGSLDNYIEMHRQRNGLSQDELAFLIGLEKGASVSRFELGTRFPTLEGILALELVFGERMDCIYPGVAEQVHDNLASRARRLLECLDDTLSPGLAAKIELLSKLARPDDVSIIPIWEDEN